MYITTRNERTARNFRGERGVYRGFSGRKGMGYRNDIIILVLVFYLINYLIN